MPKTTVHGGASNRQDEPRNNDEYSRPSPPVVERGADAAELRPPPAPAAYSEWPRPQLVSEAKRRGLPAGGTKAELALRLADADQAEG